MQLVAKKLDWDRERRMQVVRTRGADPVEREHGYHIPASDAQVEALRKIGYRGKRPHSSAHARELLRELQERQKGDKHDTRVRQTEAGACAELSLNPAAIARLRTLPAPERAVEGKALLSALDRTYREHSRTKRRDAAYQFLRTQIKHAAQRQDGEQRTRIGQTEAGATRASEIDTSRLIDATFAPRRRARLPHD
jgi:hypothetical protein